MFDLVCIGISLLDCIIQGLNETPISKNGYYAKSTSLSVGGEAFNQAVIASRLGLKTAILTGLGNDNVAQIILNELQENKVDTSFCTIENRKTPISTLLVNEDGSRVSCTTESHRYNFHPEKHLDILSSCKAISLGSLFRAPFDQKEIISEVLKAAKKNQVLTFVDTKLPKGNPLSLSDIQESLPLIDYIFPNYDEATYFTKETDHHKQADVFLNYGVNNVILKLGERGCYFKNKNEEYLLNAHQIEMIDAVGAGDNFIAGFVYSLLQGKTNKEALEFANATAAISCCYAGSTSGVKKVEQVYEFLTK